MTISLLPRLKPLVNEIFGTGIAGLGALTARQEQFEYWFRNFGTLVAVVAGTLTIYRIIRPAKPKE